LKKIKGVEVSARGDLGGLCTLWNPDFFQLERSFESTHYVVVGLLHVPTGMLTHLINVYFPNKYRHKIKCWDALLELRELVFGQNCIIVGDFNTTLHQKEKKVDP
jgi:endonuclease/exonuclease/phosphatase family metal-dependent hydrolase